MKHFLHTAVEQLICASTGSHLLAGAADLFRDGGRAEPLQRRCGRTARPRSCDDGRSGIARRIQQRTAPVGDDPLRCCAGHRFGHYIPQLGNGHAILPDEAAHSRLDAECHVAMHRSNAEQILRNYLAQFAKAY
jgi:hypothetical protein